MWKHSYGTQHGNQFVQCVMFPKYKSEGKRNCSRINRSKVRKCIHEVHLEWLNKEYHIIRWDVIYSLSIRSSLLLTVILMSSLLNSSRRPACNSCRHATLWPRYKHSARAYSDCKWAEKQVWNLSEQRWEMSSGGWQPVWLVVRIVTGLCCTFGHR